MAVKTRIGESATTETGSTLIGRHLARFVVGRSGLAGSERVAVVRQLEQLAAALDAGASCLVCDRPPLPSSLLIDQQEYICGRRAPLVYDRGRLYFYRWFHFESRLAEQLEQLAAGEKERDDEADRVLGQLFDGAGLAAGEVDRQRQAAELALARRLVIISGGPGTGKTSTVVKLLAALLHCEKEGRLRVALAAPTGKAAMRLTESVARVRRQLLKVLPAAAEIPDAAMTLHRLLGVSAGGGFRHHRNNPLCCNVVAVDEASMVDLALMSRLVDALPADARLILIGDSDQLASVESGAVLADLLAALPECSVVLRRSWRFDDNIGELAAAVNAGEAAQAWQLLDERDNLHLLGPRWIGELVRRREPYMQRVREVEDAVEQCGFCSDAQATSVFAEFRRFQILCALRDGRRGIRELNRAITAHLAAAGFRCGDGRLWYPGRPIIVTANEYSLGLFNGDIGICLPGRDGSDGRVWFETVTGFTVLHLSRLPRHETVFAMTIHKSQGSEFDSVAVVLPPEGNRLLSRELVYTAVTRAKEEVLLVADEAAFSEALHSTESRASGLRRLLASVQ